jgi:hypothetical protein
VAEINVGDLILIIISAIFGASLNSWYRSWEAKKVQEQEREGLLYLIDAELHGNELKLQNLIQDPNRIEYPRLTAPKTEDWNQAKHRLTQLLPAEHIAPLVAYYEAAQAIANAVHDSKEWASAQEHNETIPAPALVSHEDITKLAHVVVQQGKQTSRMVREYLADAPTYPVEIPPATNSGR